ncbi:ATP-binding cassette domain-containing protein [Afifella sp. IM 167]|uniref:ATP-binding cassette domain-containing protein n=1 Tax=Afifella sp. IM 167 TaxID=2033586 RepID=UPI001CCA9755|nr:ATP-binding cassette domain-containing protein [Afifella sp. IM 167]
MFSHRAWKRPVGALLLLTLTLNVLGLTIPLAAAQVFGRIIPNPAGSTLQILVIGVVALAALEAVLRYGRSLILNRTGANFAGVVTHRLLSHIVLSDPPEGRVISSRSVEYLNAIRQMREKYNGQVLVSLFELLFLPVIVGVIFFISWMAGTFVLCCLAVFALVTLTDAVHLKRRIEESSLDNEERYAFLFAMLGSMHSIKAMGIEENILRRYEAHQARIVDNNYAIAKLTGRLLNSAPIASQVLIAAMLALGALSLGRGEMTMGGVSALVLLSSRVMAPLQRAVFTFVQMKDIDEAETKVEDLLAQPVISTPDESLDVKNEGRVEIEGLAWRTKGALPLFEDVRLSIPPGMAVALTGPSEEAKSTLLQIIAGIRKPAEGEVRLNGVPPTSYPQELLNRCVAYVPSDGVLFRGTLRDNITRFGEVSVADAMEVASILEIDHLINELPNGLDTELIGSANEIIPPGLRQQLVILRALATRPRLILLDNADRGLDREGYAKLNRFVGKVKGQASLILVSDDANFLGVASQRLFLGRDGLSPVEGFSLQERTSYRDLKI